MIDNVRKLQAKRRKYQLKIDEINLKLVEHSELSQDWHNGFTAAKIRIGNLLNKRSLRLAVRGSIKCFNIDHPEWAIPLIQMNSLSKRITGGVFNYIINNVKLSYIIKGKYNDFSELK